MKQKARPENEMFAPVKERQLENEFANLQPKVALEEDFLVMEGTKGRKKKGVRNVEKKTLDVGFRVAAPEKEHDRKPRRDDDRRGGGGRGRGDGRGRGGGQKGSTGLNVNDSSAFPSL
jgi:plasminogen activator inhibitor 1 RNA-binding protein